MWHWAVHVFASSCSSPCIKWNRLWKDKCWNKFKYSCIHQNNLIDMERGIKKHWCSSSLLTLKRFHTFFSISLLNLGKCCQLDLLAEIKVQTSKNYKTCKHITNYVILTKWVKVQHGKKSVPNLKSKQIVGFEQTSMKFIEIFVP